MAKTYELLDRFNHEGIEDDDIIVLRRKRGKEQFDMHEIAMILHNEEMEEKFVIFARPYVFDGYTGDGEDCPDVVLHKTHGVECPVCKKNLEDMRADAYTAGYEDARRFYGVTS